MTTTASPTTVVEQAMDSGQAMDLAGKCFAAGDSAAARRYLEWTHRNDPSNADAVHGLGILALQNADLRRAREYLDRALSLVPTRSIYLNSRGILAERERDPSTAARFFEAAVAADPDYASAWLNLGNVRKDLRRHASAVDAYDRLLALDASHAQARFNRATALLALGRLEEGFAAYEARRRLDAFRASTALTEIEQPRWDGSPLNGKRILLHAEQGLGDTIQFLRYARVVAACGGKVIAAVQPPLAELARRFEGVDEVVELPDPLPHFDVHAPLMSCPAIVGAPRVGVGDTPYLRPDHAASAQWLHRILADSADRLRVGICWRAGPLYESHSNRPNQPPRSIALEDFEPIANRPGIALYSLQHQVTPGEQSAIDATVPVVTWGDDFDKARGAFVDSAAVIGAMDLVLTVDTSIAHLAGALGAKTWTLLPHVPDWRWRLSGDRTPWYPSMRLFRQEAPFEWTDVLKRVGRALDRLPEVMT